jgi:hypothetical protein
MDKKVQEMMAQETARQQDEALRRELRLSQKSQGMVIFLSILVAFGAYVYTQRWKALAFFLGWCVFLGIVFAGEGEEEWEPSPAAMILAATWAGVDNYLAIQRAKEKIAALQGNPEDDSLPRGS